MKKNLFQATIVALLFSSCSHDDENQVLQSNKPNRNLLIFTSNDEFQSISNKVATLTDAELDQWEDDISFKSYRRIFNQAVEKWDKIEDENQLTLFLNEYSDILTIVDSIPTPTIPIRLYQSLVNRDGLYETMGFVNKIVGQYVLTVQRDEFWKIQDLSKIDDLQTLEKIGIKVFKYLDTDSQANGRTNSTCSTQMTASYYYNPSNCRNDRKVYISLKSYYTTTTNFEGDRRQPRVELKVWGTLRTGTFCNWKSYATTLRYRNVSFSINGWSVQNGVASTTRFDRVVTDYAPTEDRNDLPWDQPIGDPLLNQQISPFAFIELHAEGASRGTNENWAILDCR